MKLAVTLGDPNGIGLETLIKSIALLPQTFRKENEIYLFGNIRIIENYIKLLNLDFKLTSDTLSIYGNKIVIIQTPTFVEITPGLETAEGGIAAFESLESTINAIQKNEFDSLITLPISKRALHLTGFSFPGHTEYLAYQDNQKKPLMILFNDSMKVALATIHEPLTKVPELITYSNLTESISIFHKSLQNDFAIKSPTIAVLGLNPHSGEQGHIGNEEIEIISPLIRRFQSTNMITEGPFPADGFFGQHTYKNYDGIFAMYHDQGLIPMKMTSMNGGVNYTAGLSFVRTSPDHGTAFSIAGKNFADPSSTLQAILWASKIAENRNKTH